MSKIKKEDHCCDQLIYQLSDENVKLNYNEKVREYSISVYNCDTISQGIQYCPFCGVKLPTSLRDEWFDLLEKDYNIPACVTADRLSAPIEFSTDKWWKQRNL